MRRGRSIALMLLVAIASACGPSRGVRLEPQGSPADQFGGEPADSGIRIVSAVFMAGQPSSLAAGRGVVWVSYAGRSAAGLQAFNPASGVASPVARFTPFSTFAPIAMATTPGVVWMLEKPLPTATEAVPDARLLRLGTPAQPARSLRSPPFPPDNLQAVAPYPRDTVLAGGNDRALWLVSPADSGYTLVRRDAITSGLRRFAIQANGSPAVAVTPRRVFVLVPVGRDTVVIQTRDTSGKVIAVSPAIRIPSFEASPLVACGDRIFGWTHGAHVRLFRINASGASLELLRESPAVPQSRRRHRACARRRLPSGLGGQREHQRRCALPDRRVLVEGRGPDRHALHRRAALVEGGTVGRGSTALRRPARSPAAVVIGAWLRRLHEAAQESNLPSAGPTAPCGS